MDFLLYLYKCLARFVCSVLSLLLVYMQIMNESHCNKINNVGFSPRERERGGLVVESLTPEREVEGSIPTSAVLCP